MLLMLHAFLSPFLAESRSIIYYWLYRCTDSVAEAAIAAVLYRCRCLMCLCRHRSTRGDYIASSAHVTHDVITHDVWWRFTSQHVSIPAIISPVCIVCNRSLRGQISTKFGVTGEIRFGDIMEWICGFLEKKWRTKIFIYCIITEGGRTEMCT